MKACLCCFVALAACSSSGGTGGSGGGGAGGGVPDAATANVINLRSMPHTLAAGTEDYRCTALAPTFDAGAAVSRFHPVNGPGVHHTVLFFTAGTTPSDEWSCFDLGLNWTLVAASGVGTGDVVFPDGIALPMRSNGKYIVQVHMLNAGQQPIDVTAGYDLTLEPPGANWQRAGMYIAGTTQFTIPAGATGYSVQGTCTGNVLGGGKLLSLFPHMHKLGVNFHVDHTTSGQTSTLYDGAFQFDQQSVAAFQPEVPVGTSDTLTVRCTWDNPGTTPVTFGLHTSDEMCFGFFYYYPATTDELRCALTLQ
jgi:hypothetical protein